MRSWRTFGPLKAERRQAFLLGVIDGLVRQVPSETLGYSTAARGPGDALFPYAELPFFGTVTLSADAAGPGFEIVITLEERLAEQPPNGLTTTAARIVSVGARRARGQARTIVVRASLQSPFSPPAHGRLYANSTRCDPAVLARNTHVCVPAAPTRPVAGGVEATRTSPRAA